MARVYVEVYGCSANLADAEFISGLLVRSGHTPIASPMDADGFIILTCVVKTPTERKMIKRLRELSSKRVPMVVAGCMPKAERWLVDQAAPEASLIGPSDIHHAVEALEAALERRRLEFIDGEGFEKVLLPRLRRNPIIHIAPIASGCLGSCSYCIVKVARGHLHSYPADGVIEDARRALEEGCREIWVTAEDTAAYRWRSYKLPQLIDGLSELEGRFYIRVGMMTPNQAKKILEDLIEAYRSEKVFKFLHLPVQSGDDEILRKMRRGYSVEEFREVVSSFREAFPSLSLSTDIIVGFPGETEEQFRESLRLIEEVKPDVLNISRFWPRPCTEAERMPGQIHGRETKRRSSIMRWVWERIFQERSREWVGWKGEVLVDERGKGETMIGRNYAYKPIALKGNVKLGDFIEVTVKDARIGYLIGEAVG
ncbi:MAG: tRNA (N(6)-L-threonylcarbamoyladenosine(37)-C(2))-methylthiotransferase [Candidatus Bathyarchaeia archaeon]